MMQEIEETPNVWQTFQPHQIYSGLMDRSDAARAALTAHMESIVPPDFRSQVVWGEVGPISGLPHGGLHWMYDGLGPLARTPHEAFSPEQVQCAIQFFLNYGEQEFKKSQQGYYSGDGWAARCLRYHLQELKSAPAPGLEA